MSNCLILAGAGLIPVRQYRTKTSTGGDKPLPYVYYAESKTRDPGCVIVPPSAKICPLFFDTGPPLEILVTNVERTACHYTGCDVNEVHSNQTQILKG